MAWTHKEKPQILKCTRALANEFANMEPAPNDRPFNESRGRYVLSKIVDGAFRLADFASVECGGKLYRVNGKHTSRVLSEMNGDFPKDLFALVERYKADSLEDVACLYSTFDTRKSLRTTNDINRAFAAANPDLAEIPPRIISRCVTGIAFSFWEESYSHRSAEERAQLLLQHPQFVLWVHLLLSEHPKDSAHLLRGPTIAAMFRTFGKSQKASTEFWTAVRDGSGQNHTAADRKLQRYLLETSVNTGNGARAGRKMDGHRAMYVKCLHAWNAWRKTESTDLKYYASAKTPSVI